ncbi:hypothetical protein CCC_01643 [Paramagnetospirillum magnetotacticum MS-1]|uniref:Uncharacterized protein n=1 Tax=Paramagnetospirillum magnetotacticum MS-1 TaxID=272627 RepID=A0A0C2U5Q5_PARME|nr:hypothetical protein CCC_01643 [Paramagnetospirillum magnetotacticum MS-1]
MSRSRAGKAPAAGTVSQSALKASPAELGPQKAAGASREKARPSGLRGRIVTQSASGKFRAL